MGWSATLGMVGRLMEEMAKGGRPWGRGGGLETLRWAMVSSSAISYRSLPSCCVLRGLGGAGGCGEEAEVVLFPPPPPKKAASPPPPPAPLPLPLPPRFSICMSCCEAATSVAGKGGGGGDGSRMGACWGGGGMASRPFTFLRPPPRENMVWVWRSGVCAGCWFTALSSSCFLQRRFPYGGKGGLWVGG